MAKRFQKLTVDPEFKDLLGPLRQMEKTELEASIEKEGCRDPIIVWANHDDTIIDGHNRYEICQRLEEKFEIEAKVFKSREDVLKWIYQNQAGRRNCTQDQLRYIRAKVYEGRKKDKTDSLKKGTEYPCPQLADTDAQRTSDLVGIEFGVSGDTILRDQQFAAAVDQLPPEERREVLAGRSKVVKNSNGSVATVKREKKTKKRKAAPITYAQVFAKHNGEEVSIQTIADEMSLSPQMVRCALLAMERSTGFEIKTLKNGKKLIHRVTTAKVVDAGDEEFNLLQQVKKVVDNAIWLHARQHEGIDFHLVWNALKEAQRLLKDVPAAKDSKSH